MTIVWTNDTTVLPIEFHIYDVNPEQIQNKIRNDQNRSRYNST